MIDSLKEGKTHGAPMFPLQIYSVKLRPKAQAIRLHWHDELEILQILDGKAEISINRQKFLGFPGDIFFVNSGCLHEISSGNLETEYNAFVFPLKLLSFEMYDFCQSRYIKPLCDGVMDLPAKADKSCSCSPQLSLALNEIERNLTQTPEGWQLSARIELLRVINILIQGGLISPRQVSTSEQKREKLMKQILGYINENLDSVLRLDSISARFGFTPKYFCSFFKQNMGSAFVEYVNSARLERAAEALLSGDSKIMSVAMSAGFDNFSYFIRCFKKRYGLTPSEYRKLGIAESGHSHISHGVIEQSSQQ